MFFIAYAFKGHMHVFAGRVKIVSHSSCRTIVIFKYFCPLWYRKALKFPIRSFSSNKLIFIMHVQNYAVCNSSYAYDFSSVNFTLQHKKIYLIFGHSKFNSTIYLNAFWDQARGRLGRNSRPRGRNFALNGTQGEVGVSLKKKKKKKIFFFFFFLGRLIFILSPHKCKLW